MKNIANRKVVRVSLFKQLCVMRKLCEGGIQSEET